MVRYPGSIIVGVLKNRVQTRVEDYKRNRRKVGAKVPNTPKSNDPSAIRLAWDKYHGHVTLWVLVGALVNTLSNVYIHARYEDIRRLFFEQTVHSENHSNSYRKQQHAEGTIEFWTRLMSSIDIHKDSRNDWLSSCEQKMKFHKDKEQLHAHAASQTGIGDNGRGLWIVQGTWQYMLSFYHSFYEHHHKRQLLRIETTCKLYKDWMQEWDHIYRVSQRKVSAYTEIFDLESGLASAHEEQAMHWMAQASRNLVFKIRMPLTNCIVRVWSPVWSDLD